MNGIHSVHKQDDACTQCTVAKVPSASGASSTPCRGAKSIAIRLHRHFGDTPTLQGNVRDPAQQEPQRVGVANRRLGDTRKSEHQITWRVTVPADAKRVPKFVRD